MELRDYVKIISRNIWLIIIVIVLTGLLSYLFTSKTKTTYSGFKTISVNKSASATNSNYYQYDGFYSASAANLQAKGLASWINTPATVNQIYEKAQLSAPEVNDKNLKNLISVKNDIDSNVVSISMTDSSKEDLIKKLDSLGELAQTYFSTITSSDQYSLRTGDNAISSQVANSQMNLLAGIFSGLIIGIVLAFGKEYFSKA